MLCPSMECLLNYCSNCAKSQQKLISELRWEIKLKTTYGWSLMARVLCPAAGDPLWTPPRAGWSLLDWPGPLPWRDDRDYEPEEDNSLTTSAPAHTPHTAVMKSNSLKSGLRESRDNRRKTTFRQHRKQIQSFNPRNNFCCLLSCWILETRGSRLFVHRLLWWMKYTLFVEHKPQRSPTTQSIYLGHHTPRSSQKLKERMSNATERL